MGKGWRRPCCRKGRHGREQLEAGHGTRAGSESDEGHQNKELRVGFLDTKERMEDLQGELYLRISQGAIRVRENSS